MSKLNRKEFRELLTEWNRNFINERNIKQFKLTYPCYLVRTLNYGDLKYSSASSESGFFDDMFDQIPRDNEILYQSLLEENLTKNGIEFSIDRNDVPDKLLQVDVKNKSLEEKKQLTRKIVNIIYETSKSDYFQDYEDDEDLVTKHPPLNQQEYNSYLNTSISDIDSIFKDMENSNNNTAPIFISHLDYNNNVYYALHDIIGHGSIERPNLEKTNKQSIEFSRKLYKIENNDDYAQLISDELQSLTPGVGKEDISSSLVSYFASISPENYYSEINNFFKDKELDDRKKEIISILKSLYEEYKKDIERTEFDMSGSVLERYSDYINICFIYLDFKN